MFNLKKYIDNYQIDDDKITIYVNHKANYKVILELKKHLKNETKEIDIKINQKPLIDKKVIALLSGKGGVGKSYVTKLFADVLSKDHKVLLLDFDIYGYSQSYNYNKYEEIRLENDILQPVYINNNLAMVCTQFFIKDLENKAIMWRAPKLNQLMQLILEKIDYDVFEYIIIDTPPTTGDIILNLTNYFSKIDAFVITTPKLLDQHVALRSLEIIKQLGFNLEGVIINEAFFNYHHQKLFIYGNQYDTKIDPLIKSYLAINDNHYNKEQIKNLLTKN